MPARSRAQQRLFQAAEHGASFPAARKIRASTTPAQQHEFASGSMKGKPAHVAKNDYAKAAKPKHNPINNLSHYAHKPKAR